MDERNELGPTGRLLLEVAGALAFSAVLILTQQLQDATSPLRLRLEELRDELRAVRDEWREERFRVEIDNLERMVNRNA